jgi:WD40 repeat protein
MTCSRDGLVLIRQQPGRIGPFHEPVPEHEPAVPWDPLIRLWNPRVGTLEPLWDEIVTAANFSPHGRWMAWAGSDGPIRLRNLTTGLDEHVLQRQGEPVVSLAFSGDGARLAGRSRDLVQLWDVASQVLTHEAPQVGRLQTYAHRPWSPDGPWLDSVHAGGMVFSHRGDRLTLPVLELYKGHAWYAGLRVWDIASGTLGPMLGSGSPDNMQCVHVCEPVVAFSPDDSLLAWAGSTCLWNAATGEPMCDRMHSDHVTGAAFAPDGSFLATCSLDATVRIWPVSRLNRAGGSSRPPEPGNL